MSPRTFVVVASLGLALPVTSLPSPGQAHPHAPGDKGHHKPHAFRWHMQQGGGASLGVNILDITPELREFFGGPTNAGVLVAKVGADTAAAKGGVLVGDVIVAVDGESIDDSWSLIRTIAGREPGAEVQVDVVRAGKRNSLTVRLDERKAGAFPGPHPRMFKDFRFEMPHMPDMPGHAPGERLKKLEERLERLEQKL